MVVVDISGSPISPSQVDIVPRAFVHPKFYAIDIAQISLVEDIAFTGRYHTL